VDVPIGLTCSEFEFISVDVNEALHPQKLRTSLHQTGRLPSETLSPTDYIGCRPLYGETRSSAIVEGPRDASCQLKSCQLPRNSAETTCTTSPEHIEVMKLEGYSGAMWA